MAGTLFCIAVLATLVVSVVLSASLPTDIMQWTYAFVTPILFLVVVFVGGRLDGTDVPRALGLTRAPRPWQAGLSIALSVACIVAFLPLALGVQLLLGRLGYHGGPSYADYTSSWGNLVLGLVALALMPALGEEALCRGMAFGALRQKGTVYGIFMSALLFGLLHGNPVQLVHQFLIGCVMAYLFHLSGSIWCTVLFHFCNNAAVIVYDFVYVQAGWSYVLPWWAYLVMCVVGLAVVAGLLCLYARLTLRHAPRREGALVFADERPTPRMRMQRLLDVNGGYVPYIKGGRAHYAMYVAFAVVGVLWLVNTITGWVQ